MCKFTRGSAVGCSDWLDLLSILQLPTESLETNEKLRGEALPRNPQQIAQIIVFPTERSLSHFLKPLDFSWRDLPCAVPRHRKLALVFQILTSPSNSIFDARFVCGDSVVVASPLLHQAAADDKLGSPAFRWMSSACMECVE